MYNADRELATTTVLRECSSGSAWSVAVATTLTADPLLRTELLLATMLASWCDRYADVFLSIGGARLSVDVRQCFRLVRQWRVRGVERRTRTALRLRLRCAVELVVRAVRRHGRTCAQDG